MSMSLPESDTNTQGPVPTTGALQSVAIPPLTVEEEDSIIYTRITNDERPLRRVIKKFHNYTALAYSPVVPVVHPWNEPDRAKDEAREAFLVELASFQLSLQKSAMICEAEARQVEEYNRARQRIELEHGSLKGHIEQLKTALEHEQLVRRQKIEYDLVAEKISTLPSRAELELAIQELENDMLAIRAEHETQNRIIQSQKSALGNIIGDLGSLRLMGKDKDTPGSEMPSPVATPPPEHVVNGAGDVILRVEGSAEVGGGSHGGEDQASQYDLPSSANINAAATPSMGHSPAPSSRLALEDDIEMGEVEEERRESPNKGRRNREELEEGEASDVSSVLSDPPDD